MYMILPSLSKMASYAADPGPGCTCKNLCNRGKDERGKPVRNACPCLIAQGFCSTLCKCGTEKQSCKNRAAANTFVDDTPPFELDYVYGEFDDHDHDEEYQDELEVTMISFVEDDGPLLLDLSDHDHLNKSIQNVAEDVAAQQLNASRSTKRRKKMKSSTLESKAPRKKAGKKGGVMASTSRTKQQTVSEKVNELIPCVKALDRDQLEAFAVTALRLHPTLAVQLNPTGQAPSPSPDAQPDSPDWCHCGNCREMPLPEEQLCCRRTDGLCTTVLAENIFNTVVLNLDVLQIAIQNRNDMLVYDVEPNNQELRNMAYRQYVLWKLGRLGAGNRVIIASCVVWRVRDTFPSPNNIYVGFKPSRLK